MVMRQITTISSNGNHSNNSDHSSSSSSSSSSRNITTTTTTTRQRREAPAQPRAAEGQVPGLAGQDNPACCMLLRIVCLLCLV